MSNDLNLHPTAASRIRASLFALAGLIFLAWALHLRAQDFRDAKDRAAAQDQAVSDGRRIFEATCAGCHGLDGRGAERGPDIATRPEVVRLNDAEILKILENGKPASGMPPFASFGAVRLQSLLAFLRRLQGKDNAAAVTGDAKRGKTVFFGAAHCSQCHMVNGAGGFIGSDLSKYGATLSAREIHDAIAKPREDADPRRKITVVTARNSEKFTGVIRNEDNFSLQLQTFDGAFHLFTKSQLAQIEVLPKPVMPADFGTTLSAEQLDDLVAYLVSVSRSGKRERNPDAEWSDEEDD